MTKLKVKDIVAKADAEWESAILKEVECPENQSVIAMLKDIAKTVGDVKSNQTKLQNRMDRLENGSDNDFKNYAISEDKELAKEINDGVDIRVLKIVEETLGEDFKVKIEAQKDSPGFLFTIIVPKRLANIDLSQRPALNEDGTYKKDLKGKVIEEDYYPEDRRSRAIASWQSFDAIREHCERVRSFIIATFQKQRKPAPEFRIKEQKEWRE